jgi:hypothetical protein
MRRWCIWKSRVGFNYCDTRHPGLRADQSASRLATLHRVYLDTIERERGKLGRLTACGAALIFFGYSLREAWKYLRSHGHACRQESGKALWRQFWESLSGQFCFHIPVMDYYANRLSRCPTEWERSGFLSQRILHKLILQLNAETQTEVRPYLEKEAFEEACHLRGLPCVSSLAMLEAGALDRRDALKAWIDTAQSFLIKPGKAYGGIRVAIFDRAKGGGWRERLSGRWLATANNQLCENLQAFAPEGSYLVQPLLHNASWLNQFSNGNLCNYRIVTALNQTNGAECICAFLRMPCYDGVLTSIEGDAGCSRIDLQNGTLGPMGFMDLRKGKFHIHPDGGGYISGYRIENWKSVLELAERAHRLIGGAYFAGWDIIDTKESGLVLLESNLLWGANLAQFNAQPLLGETRFPELYESHYNQIHGE